MKNLKILFGIALLVALNSCSNIKVLATKKIEDREGLKGKNILVIAKTTDPEVRKVFEDQLTAELTKLGLQGTQSYNLFPKIVPEKELTDDRIELIRQKIEDAGYNGVVLCRLQDHQEITREVGSGDYYASVNYGYVDWPTYMGWGFYTYYVHPLSYSTEDIYVENTSDTITAQLYIVDTIAFNLDLPKEEQFVGLVRAQVENPESAQGTAQAYARAIAKAVKKS